MKETEREGREGREEAGEGRGGLVRLDAEAGVVCRLVVDAGCGRD